MEKYNNDKNQHFDEIEKMLKEGNYLEAYQRLIKIDGHGNIGFYYLLADCLHLLGEYQSSLKILESLIDFADYISFKKGELENIEKLKIHVKKHLGKFSDALYDANLYFPKCNDDEWSYKLLSIKMLDRLYCNLKSIKTENDKKIDYSDLDFCSANENLTKYKMYKSLIICQKDKENAIKLIDEVINVFENENDRYKYNAYYIKAEILRTMENYEEAYQFYIKSSGILDNHVDINLLDQNYFSTKILETLGLVKGNISSNILECKKRNYNKGNHRKGFKFEEKKPIKLEFNQTILNLLKTDQSKMKRILNNNLFIIL